MNKRLHRNKADSLDCGDADAMQKYLIGTGNKRKVILFAVACCRRIWHLLDDNRSRVAVEVLERYADGLASEEELAAVAAPAHLVRTATSVDRDAVPGGMDSATRDTTQARYCVASAAAYGLGVANPL